MFGGWLSHLFPPQDTQGLLADVCVIGSVFLASGCQDLGPWTLHNEAYNAVTICSAINQSLMLR